MIPRGTCPSLWEPMPTGDGLLVRVKPPGGVLTAAGARTLAEAASCWGNGVIEATGRANLQIRGLQPTTVGRFAAAVVAAGLAHPDPAVERRRNVICAPLAECGSAAGQVAAALEAMLAADGRLASLPAKFGFLVDAGGVLGLAHVGADICIRLRGDGCEVGLDGGRLAARTDVREAAVLACRLAHAFLQIASPPRRMRDLVAEVDEAAVFTACGLKPVSRAPIGRSPPASVGWFPAARAFGAGLPFGTMAAGDLAQLAHAAERFGDGTLRLTPWRALILTGVTDPAPLEHLPFITDPADPLLRISACPGQPGCESATVDTRRTALALSGLALSGTVHVSGCSKGCAHPSPAALTLIGRDGRFDVVREGRASDPPLRQSLTAAEAIAGAAA